MYKVLFLGWEYYPVFTGGLGIVCQSMAEELANQDFEVYVVLPSVPKEITSSKVKFPQPVTRTVFKNTKVNWLNLDIPLNPYSNSADEKELLTREKQSRDGKMMDADSLYGMDLLDRVNQYTEMVGDLVAELEFDVIHAHDWMTYLAAINAKYLSGKKAVLHVHATELDRTGGNPNQMIFDIEREMLSRSDMVLAVSEHTKRTLTARYKLKDHHVRVLHNGLSTSDIDTTKYKLQLGKGKTVIFLGRVVVQKGVEAFVEIARKITDFLPDTNFIFAGDGPLLHKVMEMVCTRGMQENFIFTGPVNRETGDILYRNSDLFIMTSGSEPFGITALEALAQDTPVLLPYTSGVSEVLSNAIKVDYWDVDRFADYAINILMDNEFQQFLLDQQKKDLGKLTWKDQVNKLAGIYYELLSIGG